ncbi:lysophospholipase a [Phlyctema vagabunda]|uniref:Lysophospholipase a n=1 Tax=Phlyctema vagabunda TaxID=108571 RepID=A0ABR4PHZ9_9HELO
MKLTVGLALLSVAKLVKPSPTYDAHQRNSSFDWDQTKYLLAFGDSYTYVQGQAGRQNYSFIADELNPSYPPAQLLSNEIVQNQIGTSAGGPNWVEYLTGCFSGLPSKCKKQLWDFAFAGADVSTTYTPLHHNYTISFENQIAYWKKYAEPYIPVKLSRALVAVWIGINDINDTDKTKFPAFNATDFPSFYDKIIGAEFQALQTVYDAGYRNFLFMNLPPLERSPANAGSTPVLPNNTMLQSYNSLISAHADSFRNSHVGASVFVFDTYDYLLSILENPEPYGLKNTTGYCAQYNAPDIGTNYAAYGCLPIEQYFWYNTGHITFRVHELVAKEVGKFLKSVSRT